MTLVEPADPELDVMLESRTTAENRLEVKTSNVRIVKLDLDRLPRGMRARGPWNLQIDGQAIEITGRRGRVLSLVRSSAGSWSVLPPRGAP